MLESPKEGTLHFILIRGLARESRHWGRFPETLKNLHPGCRVTSLDLPGCGHYCREKTPLKVEKITEILRLRLKEIRDDHPSDTFSLIALSLGGMVASHWLKTYPKDFSSYFLINMSLGDFSRPWQRMQPTALKNVLKALITNSVTKRERFILRLASTSRANCPKTISEWSQIATTKPFRRANFFRQIIAAATYRFGLKNKPSCPTFLINSLGDALVNPICSERMAELS